MSEDKQECDQQTRVVFANGDTLILQGDLDDQAINDVNSDILQQALQDASEKYSIGDSSIADSSMEEYTDDTAEMVKNEPQPFLALLQGDQGETHTIQLTAEQARALGIHFTSDGDQKEIPELSIGSSGTDNLQLSSDMSQMVYSDGEQNEQVMFETEDMSESIEMEDESDQIIEATQENLDDLTSSMNGYITNNGGQLTLIPQFIDGQMTYTVKLPDELQDASEQFADDVEIPVTTLSQIEQSGVTYHDITSIARASPTTTTTMATRPIPMNLPCTVQQTTQCSRTSSAVFSSLLAKKKPNVSYVDVPTRSVVTNRPLSSIDSTGPLSSTKRVVHVNKSSLQSGVFRTELTNSGTVSTVAKPIPVPNMAQAKIYSKLKGFATSVTPVSKTVPTTAVSKTLSTFVPLSTGPAKFTNVLASEGKLISGLTTKSSVPSKQISSELSAALTKMPVRAINKSKPLGSSENPIQLVQHGQTFHRDQTVRLPDRLRSSVQSLNSEQLKQIATVLQRQHLESPPKATKNVIYNAETNTRIIYRVVYPEDLDLKDAGANKAVTGTIPTRGRGSGRRGRPPKSLRGGLGRAAVTAQAGDEGKGKGGEADDEDRLGDDPTKVERKKLVARTRSGRVSRPPRHMVKDYKRLHHLDFAEPDLDDSDGGYSDYQTPDQDKDGVGQRGSAEEGTKGKELLSGLVSSKRNISSHFRCPTCQKIYLGHTRMARHFEMNPDHGSIPEQKVVEKEEVPEESPLKINGLAKPTPSGRGRGKRRGPWAYTTPEARSDRRKSKLREVLLTCEATEMSEVAGPLIAGSLSLWDLLLLRVDAVRSEESYASTLCDELGALIEKVRSVVGDMLKPLPSEANTMKTTRDVKIKVEEDADGERDEHVELQDEAVCAALGLPPGRYLADDTILRPVNVANANKRFKSSEQKYEDADSPSCPEVLSALTLVAAKKPDEESPSKTIVRDLMLPSEICADPPTNRPEDLQIVDDIVSERLENLANDYVIGTNATDIETQATNLINSLEDFQINEGKSVWEKEKVIHSQFVPSAEGFDPEIALAAMGEGDQTEHFDEDLRLSRMEEVDNGEELMLGSENNADRGVYDPELELEAMGEGEQNVHQNAEFDPEMALAAMGEGERVTFDPEESLMEEEDIEYQSTLNSSSESYDPEIALAAMGEGDQSEGDKVTPVDSRTFRGLGLADVSLDESGPELDFEALSEEFNRNTRHNS